MGYSILKQNNRVNYSVTEYVVDTDRDISSLPKNCGVGSNCFVISSGNLYMLNSKKRWIPVGGETSDPVGGGASGGGGYAYEVSIDDIAQEDLVNNSDIDSLF